MKKLILGLLVATSTLVSCKKSYTCQCTAGGTIISNETIKAKTESDASEECTKNNLNDYSTCPTCSYFRIN